MSTDLDDRLRDAYIPRGTAAEPAAAWAVGRRRRRRDRIATATAVLSLAAAAIALLPPAPRAPLVGDVVSGATTAESTPAPDVLATVNGRRITASGSAGGCLTIEVAGEGRWHGACDGAAEGWIHLMTWWDAGEDAQGVLVGVLPEAVTNFTLDGAGAVATVEIPSGRFVVARGLRPGAHRFEADTPVGPSVGEIRVSRRATNQMAIDWLGEASDRVVPNVVGLPEGEAIEALSAAGFAATTLLKAVTDPRSAGVVVGQSPHASTAVAGSWPHEVVIQVGTVPASSPETEGPR